jgi:hypothetical protein
LPKFLSAFSLLFLLNLPLLAQLPADTLRTNGIRIGFDVGGFGLGLAGVSNRKIEFSGDVGFRNLFLVAEAGLGSRREDKDIFQYRQTATYLRIGIEKNVMKGNDALFFGGRYAVGLQQYEIKNLQVNDPYWGAYNLADIPPRSFVIHWLEGVAGMKVRLWRNFYTGYIIRAKIKISSPELGLFPPFTLVGFGKADKNFQLGLSYYLYYRIPFATKKAVSPPK